MALAWSLLSLRQVSYTTAGIGVSNAPPKQELRDPQLYLKKSTEMSRSSSKTTANLASCKARRDVRRTGPGQSRDTKQCLLSVLFAAPQDHFQLP